MPEVNVKPRKLKTSPVWGDANTSSILINFGFIDILMMLSTVNILALLGKRVFDWWGVENDNFISLTISVLNASARDGDIIYPPSSNKHPWTNKMHMQLISSPGIPIKPKFNEVHESGPWVTSPFKHGWSSRLPYLLASVFYFLSIHTANPASFNPIRHSNRNRLFMEVSSTDTLAVE
jgi:hypothetical protein